MFKIRNCTFETNSSAMHSIVICSKSLYDSWIKNDGTVYYNDCTDRLDHIDTIKEFYKIYLKNKELTENDLSLDDYLAERFYLSYEEYLSKIEMMEYYDESYKTDNGDEIVAFGYFGYDG